MLTYDPSVFNVGSLEQAKWVILNPDGVHSPDERWEKETAYLLEIIDDYLPVENGRGCDFGCGIGRLSKPLIERRNAAIIGVDIGVSMRNFAVEYVKSPRFIACDPMGLDQLGLFGLKFDFALAIWALQHIQDVSTDIERIRKSLRPGGRLFVLNSNMRFVPARERPWVDDGIDVWAILGSRFHTIALEDVNLNVIPAPPAKWGVFQSPG